MRGKRDQTFDALLNIVQKEKNIYPKLVAHFEHANGTYNSELFKPEPSIDGLVIEDEILCQIITELYPPKCNYAFILLPVEILGNIYEQFLGRTIHLTETHQARIEEKPEVRKAGGVYYTAKVYRRLHRQEYRWRENEWTYAERDKEKMKELSIRLAVLARSCFGGLCVFTLLSSGVLREEGQSYQGDEE